MLLGYARVSTTEQDTAAQVAALKSAGCERIYREKASGGRWDRPELRRLLDQLRKGDVLVVWKLDRLSRSLCDVLTIMEGQVDYGLETTSGVWRDRILTAGPSCLPPGERCGQATDYRGGQVFYPAFGVRP